MKQNRNSKIFALFLWSYLIIFAIGLVLLLTKIYALNIILISGSIIWIIFSGIYLIINLLKKFKRINPHIFTVSLWSGVIAIIASTVLSDWKILQQIHNITGLGMEYFLNITRLKPYIILIAIAGLLIGQIYFLTSMYKCWSIQDSTARTSPGRAVGFLFIPIFSLYWVFVALRGLAKDANAFLTSKGINENKISVGLSTATCIVAIIPLTGFIVTPLFQNILIYQWAKFFNYSVTNLGIEYK
ncbi:MAG: Uncharacterized protein FD156_953 [Nitrospirae bacterium]|nr:MAG: Uncharacterized protein FD156_953 [Nitrospirota bacterium]